MLLCYLCLVYHIYLDPIFWWHVSLCPGSAWEAWKFHGLCDLPPQSDWWDSWAHDQPNELCAWNRWSCAGRWLYHGLAGHGTVWGWQDLCVPLEFCSKQPLVRWSWVSKELVWVWGRLGCHFPWISVGFPPCCRLFLSCVARKVRPSRSWTLPNPSWPKAHCNRFFVSFQSVCRIYYTNLTQNGQVKTGPVCSTSVEVTSFGRLPSSWDFDKPRGPHWQ